MLLCNYKKGEKMKKFKKISKNTNIDIIFDINENNVKEEWERQSALYQEYCIKSIKAIKAKNRANLALDTIKAEISLEIRKNPTKFIDKKIKITEDVIKCAVILDPLYQKSENLLIDTEYQAQLFANVLKSLEHRKKSLEFFGQIYLMSLYSEPNELALTDSRIRKRLNRKGGEKG